MKIVIKKGSLKSQIKIMLFFLYNLFYTLNMSGYPVRNLYLIAITLFIFYCAMDYFSHPQYHMGLKEVKPIIFFIFFISVETLFIQLINFNLDLAQWLQMLYWILPLAVAYFWFNTTEDNERNVYFYILFARLLLRFVLNYASVFTKQNILSISWNNSMSSIFESSDAHNFLFMTMVFFYFDKKMLAYISAFLCLLSFKRLSFILVVLLVIFYKYIPQKKVPNFIVHGSIIFFSVSPFIVILLLTPSVNDFFMSLGIDLDSFTSNRLLMIQQVISGISTYNGFGTMNTYMQMHPFGYYHPIYIMHCDYYMLYKECSIISVVLLTISVLKPARKDWKIFLMALYICIEMLISTFFNSVAAWTIFYMFEFVIYYRNEQNTKLSEPMPNNIELYDYSYLKG